MKIRLVSFLPCILLFFTIIGTTHSQNIYSGNAQYKVIYEYTFDRSHLEKKPINVTSEMQDIAKEAEQLAGQMSGSLIFNNKASIYFSPESILSQNKAQALANALVNSDRKYYYFRESGHFVTQNLTFGRKINALDDREKFWNILPDKAVINGINCQKAEGIFKTPGFNDTVVEVWFATDIPFPYGPIDVYGLPGLIVKYKRGVFEIKATQITRLTDKEVDLIIPDFGYIPIFSETLR